MKLIGIFAPVLNTIKEKDLTLDLESFEKLAYEHYQTLSTYNKDIVLEFGKKYRNKEEDKLTFVVLF